jgi:Carboxypeptidase regulatory-like domain/TonB dependent receptor
MTVSRLGCLALVFSLLTAAGQAQTGTGSLRGQVTDPSGASVPGANVTATGPSGAVKVASTNEKGAYNITGLAPGQYSVRVLAKGFDVFESKVDLGPAAAQTLNASLVVVAEKQEVTVTDQLHVDVDPSNNASQLVLKGTDLDVLSDNPDDLQQDLQALAGPSVGPNGGQIYIDGFTGGRLPPKESIREIRINQNPFSAEYDKLGYGRIEIFTKPGSDKYHGNAMFNFGDDVFNSRNPLAPKKVPYQQKNWGGNFSGPLSKKSSFFVDFERRSLDDNVVVNAVILDPSLNIVPFSQAVVAPNVRTTVSPRLDYQLSPSNTLVFRYTYTDINAQNVGVGQFSLLSRGYTNSTKEQTVQATDTIVLSPRALNETRVQYIRMVNDQNGDNSTPAITVPQTFTGGGANLGFNFTNTNQYEVNNSTSFTFATHTLKFGGRMRGYVIDDRDTTNYNGIFTFTSMNAYQQTLLLQQQGVSPAQIRAMGFGASQFTIEGGNPIASVNQFDLGFFAQDDWRLAPKFTLSAGLRYETQNNIGDRSDWAPRVGIAWGLGGGKTGPKTVLRAGIGLFYDRFTQDLTLSARHLNGLVQQQYIVTSPDFFPNVPNLSSLTATPQTIWQVDSHLHAPYVAQAAIGIDRQLPRNTSISVTYANSHGVHQLRARAINSPLPGTFVQGVPNSGVRPFPNVGNIYQYESSGIFNQQQLITNVNSRLSSKVSLFGFFTVASAKSNTDGSTTFPANQYDESTEYSRATFDTRFRAFVGGSVTAPLAIRISPFISESSGRPFNITIGKDVYGDTLFNARPAFAVAGRPAIETPWGNFDPNPLPGETIIPRNYGTGPSQFSVNLRVSRTWGFGGETGGGRRESQNRGGESTFGRGMGGDRGGRGGGGDRGRGGRGGGGPFGGDAVNTGKRYNLTLSLSARNLFNHENFGTPIGNLNSPLFGRSNSLASGFGPGGNSSGAGNRRIEMRLMFTF